MCLFLRKRCTYIDNLRSGCALMTKTVLYTYSTGNSLGSIHFIWRIPEEISEEDLLSGNSEALRKIEPSLPTYDMRAMRKQFFNQVGLFCQAKPAVLRAMYKQLTFGGVLDVCVIYCLDNLIMHKPQVTSQAVRMLMNQKLMREFS